MSEIFISYAREDRAFVARLAKELEAKGFTVWWDWDLVGGTNFRTRIRDAIHASRKTIVLWSGHSVASGFVIDEANEGRKLGKLIPVLIDDSQPPFGFGDLHTITLRSPADDLDVLVAALNDTAPARPAHKPRNTLFRKMAAACGALLFLALAAYGTYWMGESYFRHKLAAPNRTALVIGNSRYLHLPVLENPIRDAERVSEALEKRGFKVIKATDVGKEAMTRLFTDFETALSVFGGVGLFYYAGSAAYIDGEDILIPIDAMQQAQERKLVGGVNLTELRRQVRSRTTSALSDKGVAVIYSASKGQFAADGPPGGNSPFTTAFLRSLEASDELNDAFRNIRSEMEAGQKPGPEQEAGRRGLRTIERQDPYLESNLGYKFYFNRPERDLPGSVAKILIFDSCRDNPFKLDVAKN